jgi:hypothetical protein
MSQKPERLEAEGDRVRSEVRKPYVKPEIIHELELETRAGTPLVVDPLDPFDPLGLEPKK